MLAGGAGELNVVAAALGTLLIDCHDKEISFVYSLMMFFDYKNFGVL